MEITLNGERREVSGAEMTVRELLEAMDVTQAQGVAVAVNERVVTRSRWDEATVEAGDEVEVIRAAQGG